MGRTISRRNMVRIISFFAAFMVTLGTGWLLNYREKTILQRELESTYMRSIEDLSEYIEDVGNNLTKSMYTGTSEHLSYLTNQLCRDSGYAKNCLSQVPTSYVSLEKTYKFLSQVGNYAQSLSKKLAAGGEIASDERNNLKALKEYCDQMLDQLAVIKDEMYNGTLSYKEVKNDSQGLKTLSSQPGSFGDGMTEFEDGLNGYPMLIYDGPFSDHLLEREPLMTKNASEVSRSDAKDIAAFAANIKARDLKESADNDGTMPEYNFTDTRISVSVTKKGGFLAYLLNSRRVSEEKLTTEQGFSKADEYLARLGINDLEKTYYETANNILTINFAHMEKDVLCYTDLVKVSVALDNGDIVGYDAQGYLTNHHARDLPSPKISAQKASESLSPLLAVESQRLTLIPSQGLNELFCYEFKCTTNEGQSVLVYVNAETGAEEQILIIIAEEDSILTV